MTTPRIPLTPFQSGLPSSLPRHLLRRIVPGAGGCWIVQGAEHLHGYQRVSIDNRTQIAHRVAYELIVGPIPEGHHLDHLCRTRACCNPAHLEPVTPDENNRRSESTSAVNARRTHCVKGHVLAGDNLYIRPDGRGRQCVTCVRAHEKAHRARKAVA